MNIYIYNIDIQVTCLKTIMYDVMHESVYDLKILPINFVDIHLKYIGNTYIYIYTIHIRYVCI